MTLRFVHRPARVVRPAPPSEPVQVEAPPTLPEGRVGSPAVALLPIVGVASSLTMMITFRGKSYAAIGAVVLLVAVVAGLSLLLTQRGQSGRARRSQRERYLDYLEELRQAFGEREREARQAAQLVDPPPAALYDVIRDPERLWERRRTDPDFLRVRVGTGAVPDETVAVREQGSAMTPSDPFLAAEAAAVARRFGAISGMPVPVDLDAAGNVSLVGARADVLALARALLCRLAVDHAPEDVSLAIAHPPDRSADWEWLRWLPHILDPLQRIGPAEPRRVAPDPAALAALLADDLARRSKVAAEGRRTVGLRDAAAALARLVVVHDTYGEVAQDLALPDRATTLPEIAVTVLHLVADRVQEPADVAIRITADGRGGVRVEDLRAGGARPGDLSAELDAVSAAMAGGFARMLAPLRLSAASLAAEPPAGGTTVDLPALLGVEDAALLDPNRAWAGSSARDFLRVPVGVDDSGSPMLLDLKEPAQLGMGPHGLCVGATGSGKSELLRTLILALAVTHDPEHLAMILVDYKGGATFAPFADIGHVAGVMTNLAEDSGLVERVHASIAGEVRRRQQLLRDASDSARRSNIDNVDDYALARRDRPGLPPLPHLLVIIDEFGELLTARPDFIDLFLSIGRIGRSIGIHLLLASQRIEAGRLKGLETYLSYRLGLRTFSEAESRTVLETPDAFHLPPLPGFGYLKVDTTVYRQFKACFVSGPYRGPTVVRDEDAPDRPLPYPIMPARSDTPLRPERTGGGAEAAADPSPAPADPEPTIPERSTGPTQLDVMLDRLRAVSKPTHRVWLPPLPAAVTLDAVAGRLTQDDRGLRLSEAFDPMTVPLGVLDDPARQWQGTWVLDLRTAGGHVAVIGAPQAGKTSALRTLVASLALTHTPRQVGVYGLDLSGSGLLTLTGFPHVGGVAVRADRERLRRTCEELRLMLDHRERVFRDKGVDSVDTMRRRHAAGELGELPVADVVCVIDGFGGLRSDFTELETMVTDLLRRGGGFGIHVVASMLRWNDVPIASQTTFGTRLELRLGEADESAIDRRLAATITAATPGRALTDTKLFGQVALARADGLADEEAFGAALSALADASAAAWGRPGAPPVRVLPTALAAAALPDADAEPDRVPVGVDEARAAPVLLDLFGEDQHLVVLGEPGCGKTNLLRLVAAGLAARHTADDLTFAVFDPRRRLRDAVDEAYLGGRAINSAIAAALTKVVCTELDKRVPGDDSAAELMAEGQWYTGPRIVLLVDDYDVLTAAGMSPLAPFERFLPQAREIGLYVVLSRRMAGAATGVFADAFLRAVMQSGATGLVMSGDRSEGQIFPGVWPGPQPRGRGLWVRRGSRPRVVQTALAPPPPRPAGAPPGTPSES
jgi:S-DNA-T family DNA segregation ATPase FtsK/SpoIIIE